MILILRSGGQNEFRPMCNCWSPSGKWGQRMRAVVLTLLLLYSPLSASTIRVPIDQSTIQAGIDSASVGDTVLVADGTYTGDGNREIDFVGKAVVLMSENGPESCVIDAEGTEAEPHWSFYFHNSEDSTSMIIGITIKNGRHSDPLRGGGAVAVENASPSFSNCALEQHYGSNGGAVYIQSGSPTFDNCRFTNNESIKGGAVFCRDGSQPVFTDCSFSDNLGFDGGAIHTVCESSLTLTRCLGVNNTADHSGGFLYALAPTWLSHCTLVGNAAAFDGSAVRGQPVVLDRCIVAYGRDSSPVSSTQITISCTDIFGHAEGDWIGSIADQANINGNICLNPRFCNRSNDDYHIDGDSPCAADNNDCAILIGALAVACAPDNRVWHLRADGTGDVPTIQAAVDAARHGDTLLLVAGTYTGDGNRDIDLHSKALVIRSESGAEQTIVDCEATSEDPHRGFVLSGASESTVIEGLTVAHAYAPFDIVSGDVIGNPSETDMWSIGGGMLCLGSSPIIRNCHFVGNWGRNFGGGMACLFGGAPRLEACQFSSDSADAGGGLYCRLNASPIISNCSFTENWSQWGAAVAADSLAVPRLENSVIEDNIAGHGAMAFRRNSDATLVGCLVADNQSWAQGGGVYIDNASPSLSNCVIQGNTARNHGGGFWIINHSRPLIENCLIADNTFSSSQNVGGGVYLLRSAPRIQNCTFIGHAATQGAHVYMYDRYGEEIPLIRNSIFAYGAGGGSIQTSDDAVPFFIGCNMFGNLDGNWTDDVASQLGVNGNMIQQPLFCDHWSGDFHLLAESPCAPTNSPNGMLIGAYDVACGISGRNWLVDPVGTGDAPTIQAAIDSSIHGDTILLATGVYTGEGNRDLSFHGKLLTLMSESGAESTTIDLDGTLQHPARGFLFDNWEDSNAVVGGITICNGWTNNGGGIFCDVGTAPRITNCVITGNHAESLGGGIAIQQAAPRFEFCEISHNYAQQGGACYMIRVGAAVFSNCSIVANEASPYSNGECDGLYCFRSSPIVENSIIAFHPRREAVFCEISGSPQISCTNIYGNEGGNWVGCIDSLALLYGNMEADPLFCDTADHNFRLLDDSPCAPLNNSCNELIGAYPVGCDPMDVEEQQHDPTLPTTYALRQNYPNPFNPSTTISYALPERSRVRLTVYNILGQVVIELVNTERSAGEHAAVWDGRDSQRRPVSTGVYLYRLEADNFTRTRKMLLLK